MPRGQKTDNKMIAKIMTSYALTNSYNRTAKDLGISDSTVKKVIQEHQEEFGKVREQKKEEFIEKSSRIIDKALELLDKRFTTALENQEQLEELIDLVLQDEEAEADKRMSFKEKKDIVKRISRLELNNLSEITTSLGTLYDKRALAKGEATENTTFKVDIEVIE